MNCLVIGYGSIGHRHASVLAELGLRVHVVTKRDIKDYPCYKTIGEALGKERFDYVVISCETSGHYRSFQTLNSLGYAGKVLIEKPVFSELPSPPQADTSSVFVAYNLRFHPIIRKLRELFCHKKPYSIHVYVGQYLPSWRPDADYTKCYSASRARGGGVLKDLSHELDYINWIAGPWKRVAAIGGKFSELMIDSDDVFSLLIETEHCPVVSVQLNYLDFIARRDMNLKET
jgi:predicted dehydrogenase